MKRYNPKYFINQDLIGVEIYAKQKFIHESEFKFIGTVVDETKNTLSVEFDKDTKLYIKDQYIFQCWLPQQDGLLKLLQFDGQKIVGRPESRIKLLRKTRRKYH